MPNTKSNPPAPPAEHCSRCGGAFNGPLGLSYCDCESGIANEGELRELARDLAVALERNRHAMSTPRVVALLARARALGVIQ